MTEKHEEIAALHSEIERLRAENDALTAAALYEQTTELHIERARTEDIDRQRRAVQEIYDETPARIGKKAALTAAAEVDRKADFAIDKMTIDITIERCAQVVDALAAKVFDDPVLRDAAAAIRALKEKP